MEYYYRIAELTVKMDTYGTMEHLAIPYRIQKPTSEVDIEIIPNREWILQVAPDLLERYREAIVTYKPFFKAILDYNGIYIHSSALVVNNKAYLFTANSGTGKSTHTSLWRNVFGDDKVRILNDDKPVLRLMDGNWYAYGTPWSGKTDLNLNLKVPLGGICALYRGRDNKIWRIGGSEAIKELIRQTVPRTNPEIARKTFEMLDKLVTQIPVWHLECNMEPEAAIVAYEAMSGEKWRKEHEA